MLQNDPDFELWLGLSETRRAIFTARGRELAQHGITVEQAGVLFAIYVIGNAANPTAISRRLLREPHTISTILNRLERKGLLKKSKDMPKKNMIRATLTEKGWQTLYQTAPRQSIHSIMSVLSEEERRKLKELLDRLLYAALRETGNVSAMPLCLSNSAAPADSNNRNSSPSKGFG